MFVCLFDLTVSRDDSRKRKSLNLVVSLTVVKLKATGLRRRRPLLEQEKLQQHCGCVHMTSYILSDAQGELPNPLSPVAMGRHWNQNTYAYCLFRGSVGHFLH